MLSDKKLKSLAEYIEVLSEWEMMTRHFQKVCKHGVIVSQCRCPGPKPVDVVPCPKPLDRKCKEY